MGIGAVIKALRTSVSLSWTIGVALAVIVVIMLMSFFLVLPKFKVLQEKLDRINLIMKERLTGLLVIRAFTTEKTEEDRFDDANEELKKINMFVNRAMSFMMPALMFVMNGVSILIIWAGAHLVDSQSLMIGDMLAYLQYAMHVIMSFLYITMMFIMLPRAAVSMQRIGKVLERRSRGSRIRRSRRLCSSQKEKSVSITYRSPIRMLMKKRWTTSPLQQNRGRRQPS